VTLRESERSTTTKADFFLFLLSNLKLKSVFPLIVMNELQWEYPVATLATGFAFITIKNPFDVVQTRLQGSLFSTFTPSFSYNPFYFTFYYYSIIILQFTMVDSSLNIPNTTTLLTPFSPLLVKRFVFFLATSPKPIILRDKTNFN